VPKVLVNNCEDVVSSQYEDISKSLSKRDVDVTVVAVDMHHTSISHLDYSLEGMSSLVDASSISE